MKITEDEIILLIAGAVGKGSLSVDVVWLNQLRLTLEDYENPFKYAKYEGQSAEQLKAQLETRKTKIQKASALLWVVLIPVVLLVQSLILYNITS